MGELRFRITRFGTLQSRDGGVDDPQNAGRRTEHARCLSGGGRLHVVQRRRSFQKSIGLAAVVRDLVVAHFDIRNDGTAFDAHQHIS